MVQPYTDEKQEKEAVPENHFDTAPYTEIVLICLLLGGCTRVQPYSTRI